MPRVLLLLAIVITAYILIRRVQNLPPHKRRAGYLQLLFGGAAVAVVLLTLAGKMHWIGAAVTGLLVAARQALPLLIRSFPLLAQWLQQRQGPGQSGSQHSEVKSQFLRMTLDHSSGELDGEVTNGPFKDWFLREMDRQQLLDLLEFCRANDPDSEQLLSSYLEQRFPEGFDQDAQSEADEPSGSASTGMTRREALAVLGLDDDATEDDIIAAHRSLIQKLHPDRGGNDYLAAKINEAKDFLLKA